MLRVLSKTNPHNFKSFIFYLIEDYEHVCTMYITAYLLNIILLMVLDVLDSLVNANRFEDFSNIVKEFDILKPKKYFNGNAIIDQSIDSLMELSTIYQTDIDQDDLSTAESITS